MPLPEAGEARQGVRVTLNAGESVLTVDLVAVRVGDDAASLTIGTLTEPSDAPTWTATETGAQRLAEVRLQGRAQV